LMLRNDVLTVHRAQFRVIGVFKTPDRLVETKATIRLPVHRDELKKTAPNAPFVLVVIPSFAEIPVGQERDDLLASFSSVVHKQEWSLRLEQAPQAAAVAQPFDGPANPPKRGYDHQRNERSRDLAGERARPCLRVEQIKRRRLHKIL
jgi:hypothetical protein